jgi:molybdopterin converting factor small subunit
MSGGTRLLLPPAARALAGGAAVVYVAAGNVRQLVAELDSRFPGLGQRVEREMALVIDGEIWQNAYDVPIPAGAEVTLIPRLKGG